MITYVLDVLFRLMLMALIASAAFVFLAVLNRLMLAHMTSFAVGAYVYAITGENVHLLVAIGVAIIVAALFYLAITRLCQAADNDTYALATLAAHLATIGVITNMRDTTGGAHGFKNIVPMFGDRSIEVLALATILLGLLTGGLFLMRSQLGLMLYAVGDDMAWSQSLGIPSGSIVRRAALCSGAIVGFAGALHAAHSQYISPDRFAVLEAIAVAGVATMFPRKLLATVLLAAGALVLVPEVVRFLPWTTVTGANARRVVFCAFLILSAMRADVRR